MWSSVKQNAFGGSVGLFLGSWTTSIVNGSYLWGAATLVAALSFLLIWLFDHFRKNGLRLISTIFVVTLGIVCWSKVVHPVVAEPKVSAFIPFRPSDLTGSSFAGIVWRDRFTEVVVDLINPSDFDYEAADFTISTPKQPQLIEVGYDGGVACAVIPGGGVSVLSYGSESTSQNGRTQTHRIDNNDPETISNDEIINPGPKRVQCPNIPKGSAVRLILALDNYGGLENLNVTLSGNYRAAHRDIPLTLQVPVNR